LTVAAGVAAQAVARVERKNRNEMSLVDILLRRNLWNVYFGKQ
jgi:hypothetical protein